MYMVSLFMIAVWAVAASGFCRSTECRAVRCVSALARIMSGIETMMTAVRSAPSRSICSIGWVMKLDRPAPKSLASM
jgi:hypothetical protein